MENQNIWWFESWMKRKYKNQREKNVKNHAYKMLLNWTIEEDRKEWIFVFFGGISCFVLCVVESVFSFACKFNRSKRKIDETENQKWSKIKEKETKSKREKVLKLSASTLKMFTSRFCSSKRAASRRFSNSSIISRSIWTLAASTRRVTSASISSLRFSNSSSTRFFTKNSIRLAVSSSTVCK